MSPQILRRFFLEQLFVLLTKVTFVFIFSGATVLDASPWRGSSRRVLRLPARWWSAAPAPVVTPEGSEVKPHNRATQQLCLPSVFSFIKKHFQSPAHARDATAAQQHTHTHTHTHAHTRTHTHTHTHTHIGKWFSHLIEKSRCLSWVETDFKMFPWSWALSQKHYSFHDGQPCKSIVVYINMPAPSCWDVI